MEPDPEGALPVEGSELSGNDEDELTLLPDDDVGGSDEALLLGKDSTLPVPDEGSEDELLLEDSELSDDDDEELTLLSDDEEDDELSTTVTT